MRHNKFWDLNNKPKLTLQEKAYFIGACFIALICGMLIGGFVCVMLGLISRLIWG